MPRSPKNRRCKPASKESLKVSPAAQNIISALSTDGWDIVSFHHADSKNNKS